MAHDYDPDRARIDEAKLRLLRQQTDAMLGRIRSPAYGDDATYNRWRALCIEALGIAAARRQQFIVAPDRTVELSNGMRLSAGSEVTLRMLEGWAIDPRALLARLLREEIVLEVDLPRAS